MSETSLYKMQSGSGYFGALSPEQSKVLADVKAKFAQQFRQNPRMYHDQFLLRFCRARKFDFEATSLMLSNFIQFLKEYGVESVSDFIFEEVNEFKSFVPHGHCGVDKGGHPMYWEKLGGAKLKKAHALVPEERYIRQFLFEYMKTLELRMVGASLKEGRLIETFVSVIDVSGISLLQFSPTVSKLIKKIIKMTSDNFPETLHKMYIVNAPRVFSGIWSMIKPWLDEKTQKKISILSTDYMDVMLKDIDIDQIPDAFGGTAPWLDLGPWTMPEILAIMKRWPPEQIVMMAARQELWPIDDPRWEVEQPASQPHIEGTALCSGTASQNQFVTRDGWPLLIADRKEPIPGNGPHASERTKAAAAAYVKKLKKYWSDKVKHEDASHTNDGAAIASTPRKNASELQELQALSPSEALKTVHVSDVSNQESPVHSSFFPSLRLPDPPPSPSSYPMCTLPPLPISSLPIRFKRFTLSELSVFKQGDTRIEYFFPGLCAVASFMLVRMGLKKFFRFHKHAWTLEHPLKHS